MKRTALILSAILLLSHGGDYASAQVGGAVPVSRRQVAAQPQALPHAGTRSGSLPQVRQLRQSSARTFTVTAYCQCRRCCGAGAKGITASGRPVTANGGAFVAADWKVLNKGALVSIPGYHAGRFVPVLDTGSAIKGNRLDLYMSNHASARKWGVRTLQVTIYRKGSK